MTARISAASSVSVASSFTAFVGRVSVFGGFGHFDVIQGVCNTSHPGRLGLALHLKPLVLFRHGDGRGAIRDRPSSALRIPRR